jgi:N-acetylglutamate synthase-like GNAT family acetyltransferase
VDITLHPATTEHEGFLYRVFSGSRAAEVAQLPWDEDRIQDFLKMQFTAQQRDYQERFPNADHHVILRDGNPVGRLYVDRREREIRILDIAVLPEHRSAGTGAFLLDQLINEGRQSHIPVRVWIENHNPSYRLFTRLGFVSIEEDGFLHLLECRPSTEEAASSADPARASSSDRPDFLPHPEGETHETH